VQSWGMMSRVFIRQLGSHNRLRPRIGALSRSVSTFVSISESSIACDAIIIAGLDGRYYSERPYCIRRAYVLKQQD
jgi:hypothetical protein